MTPESIKNKVNAVDDRLRKQYNQNITDNARRTLNELLTVKDEVDSMSEDDKVEIKEVTEQLELLIISTESVVKWEELEEKHKDNWKLR